MNLLREAKYALKMSVDCRLATPLLLRSGLTGDITDSSIEKTPDDTLHVNGYVWAGLLRRSLDRLPEGKEFASLIGKYRDEGGVSPLWCEATFATLHATAVNPGIAIDRKWGAAKSGALFSDELAIAGLPLTLRFTLFAVDREEAEERRELLLKALNVVNDGIENIGGGWTYGYGRLAVEQIETVGINFTESSDRKLLWQWDGLPWEKQSLVPSDSSATVITVTARVAPGQLLAVKSGVFPMDAPQFGKLPDTFVFRRNRLVDGKSLQEPVIPGKALRQALFSVPLERKWRSQGERACSPHTDKNECSCKRCRWFGSTNAAGIIAVTDAPVQQAATEVINRVQLCEHSMQNMNLFSGEYLTAGEFRFKIIIDNSRVSDAPDLVTEISELLEEMKGKNAPPGWYRLGGTATCTGQVEVVEYAVTRSALS